MVRIWFTETVTHPEKFTSGFCAVTTFTHFTGVPGLATLSRRFAVR